MSNIYPLYGFYSDNQKKQYGSALYSKPDGSQVEVTEVAYDPSPNIAVWRDMIALGEVDCFICTLSLGMYSMSPVKNIPLTGFTIIPTPDPIKQSAKQDEPPTVEADISDWHSWTNKTPGQCPCGIARQDCWIHRT